VDIAFTDNFCQSYIAQEVVNLDLDYIFHFAASASVSDSVSNPGLYYINNTAYTAQFLDYLNKCGWKGKFIFSSTAATYGNKFDIPIQEEFETNPCNAYGHSKLMCERIITDICTTAGIDAVMFRYFNVAGAHENSGDHLDSEHIIPKICNAVHNEKKFTIFGSDYSTIDGTNIRDYVHVIDVCRAHLHAANWLSNSSQPGVYTFNLGSSNGFSNKEIIDNFPVKVDYQYGDRRAGDPGILIADNRKFIEATSFEYKHTNLRDIIDSSWKWYKRNINDSSKSTS
jgi:UDP-glucose 4-epimerase